MARKALHFLRQRDHRDLGGTGFPVMLPTHNNVTAAWVVPMIAKVTAAELELDADALPALVAAINTPLGLAIRVSRVDGFDDEANTPPTADKKFA